MTSRMAAAALLTLAFAGEPNPLSAQSRFRVKDLAAGKFLVAQRDLPDPNFFDTVIVLVRYDDQGAMGLVINRRTRLPLSRLFRNKGASSDDPVFSGGPVSKTGVVALLRQSVKPEDAIPVLGDVYMTSSRELVESSIAARARPNRFRAYLGYAGWAPRQLEREVETGTWHIFPGDPALVFDPEPESLWLRLIRRTELQFAVIRAPLRQ